jgi:hypothetical protein
MDMAKPTDDHRKLEKLIGSWVGEEHIHPSPSDPRGGVAVGRVLNRLALGGLIVVQEYEQERNGSISARGHGVFSWDPTQHCYALHWFDSWGLKPSEFHGDFQGPVLTLISKEKHGLSRAVFSFLVDGSYTFKMDVSKDGNHWYTCTEGHYLRQ